MNLFYSCALLCLFGSPCFGQDGLLNIDKKGLAIQGYDPVSYFTDEMPAKGNPNFEYAIDSRKYRFSSESNKSVFIDNPDKYEPVYGGWCAYAIGLDGSKVKIDPETYKIIDNELYLFYNFFFVNTLDKWNEDELSLKQKADDYWKQMKAME